MFILSENITKLSIVYNVFNIDFLCLNEKLVVLIIRIMFSKNLINESKKSKQGYI